MSPIEKLYQAKRVLCILTHPDDEVMLIPLISQMQNVHIIYAVDGVPGDCFNNQCATKPLAQVRQEELANSAALHGFTYEMCHLPFAGNLANNSAMISEWQGACGGYLHAAISRFVWMHKPDVIITFDPRHGTTTFVDNTPSEHRATGQVVLDALQGFRNIVLIDHRLDMRDGKIGYKQGTPGSQKMQIDFAGWNKMIHTMEHIYPSQFDAGWIQECEAATPDMRCFYFADA